jgi:PadR family transcriptional regulator
MRDAAGAGGGAPAPRERGGAPRALKKDAQMALTNQPPDLLPGTLDMLILRSLIRGPMHGYGIADRLRQVSQEVLQVGESSLYPALQRLLLNGWVKATWGASENNRRARFYTLTAAGKRRLEAEREEFQKLIVAIQRVLETA